jgi:hypothetical protein
LAFGIFIDTFTAAIIYDYYRRSRLDSDFN